MATKKKIFIIAFGIVFCVAIFQRKHSGSKEVKEVTESSFTEMTTTTASDSLELTALIKNLLKWHEPDRLEDFDVISSDDSIYTGINWDVHRKRMLQIRETKFFTEDFLENYQNIAIYLDKELKKNPKRYYVGELPPYGNGANEWCDCQDYAYNWEHFFMIVDLKIDTDFANFKWTWDKEHYYFIRAQKDNNSWRISYMERFDIKNFIW